MEGYVLHTYGKEKFLRHAVASVITLKRHDTRRPVALYADAEQLQILRNTGLNTLFDVLEDLPPEHQSIVGFKHHLDRFSPFEKNLFVDADMVWCRDPDPLWRQLSAFSFTATGLERADFFFGGPKGFGVIGEFVFDRRRRTMRRFDVSYLPRVQAGMIYAADPSVTEQVCAEARNMLSRQSETHFRSRLHEGRTEESCEWSLALAMSRLNLPLFNWYQGQQTPQMDFIEGFVRHDTDFENVSVIYNNDRFVHGLRGIPSTGIRDLLIRIFSAVPGKGDHMWITPFSLHFGWMNHKEPFHDLADRLWESAVSGSSSVDPSGPGSGSHDQMPDEGGLVRIDQNQDDNP